MPLTEAERLELERKRQEHAAQTLRDIDEMDTGVPEFTDEQLAGGQEEPAGDQGTPADQNEPIEPEEPAEPEPVTVATAEPEPGQSGEPAKEEPATEPEDGYDFAEFLNQMARQAMGAPEAPPQVQQQAPAAAPAPVAAAPVPAPIPPTPTVVAVPTDLVTLKEMEAAYENPELMVELMGRVYQRAITDAANLAVQTSLRSLPGMVQPIVAQQQTLAQQAMDFYKTNSDLQPYADFVQYVARRVEATHPEFTVNQVFAETAKVARSRLPMLKAAQAQNRKKTNPSFVGQQKGRSKPVASQLSALENDIASMPDNF